MKPFFIYLSLFILGSSHVIGPIVVEAPAQTRIQGRASISGRTVLSQAVSGSTINATPVQKTKSSGSTNAVVWPGNTTTGNGIVVSISTEGFATVPTSCTDSQSNTYTEITHSDSGVANYSIYLFVAKNITGGTTPTITCPMSGVTTVKVIAVEYQGGSTTALVDSFTISDQSQDVGPITTALANELLLVVATHDGLFSACTGYALVEDANGFTQSDIQSVVGATSGMYTASMCSGGSFFTAMILVSLK